MISEDILITLINMLDGLDIICDEHQIEAYRSELLVFKAYLNEFEFYTESEDIRKYLITNGWKEKNK